MNKLEYEITKNLLIEKREEFKNNKKIARTLLINAGIFTKNGKLKKEYK